MIDYKKYIQVLEILKREKSENPVKSLGFDTLENPEQKASAICELFDERNEAKSVNVTPPKYPKTLQDLYGGTDPIPCTQCIGITQ